VSTDPFASPKRRLARAKEHISDIEAGIRRFFESEPDARVVELNSRRFEEHKIKLTKPIPSELTDIATKPSKLSEPALITPPMRSLSLAAQNVQTSSTFPSRTLPHTLRTK
jgi:hypothetical protein